MSDDEIIPIPVTKSEAIVLHAFLSRFNMKEDGYRVFEDPAEQKVFWNIECELEKVLAEPFYPNYVEILTRARIIVNDEENTVIDHTDDTVIDLRSYSD